MPRVRSLGWETESQIARLWAARNPHIVCCLPVGITFAVELFVSVGVAESEYPFASVLAIPLAFLPLAFLWLAIDRANRFTELRRLVVGKWRAERADGGWQIQFTRDALTADCMLYTNLELVASDQVRAILGEWIVGLSEGELVLTVGGAVCRFTRVG